MAAKIKNHLDNISDRAVLLILLAFFAGAILGSARSHISSGDANWWSWFDSFWQNFGTEMFGAFLTFLLIEMLRGRRRDKEVKEEEEKKLRERLIRDLSSNVNDVAVQAANDLRAHGWGFGEDMSLMGVTLFKADLQGANLTGVKLQGATLAGINLQGADLGVANLQGAILAGANLQGAILYGANLRDSNLVASKLQGAYLYGARLQGAILAGAGLQRAGLVEANLEGAQATTCEQLQMAAMLLGTTLPDGTKLPNDDTWGGVFAKWCETVETDAEGYIQVSEVTKRKTKRKTAKHKAAKPI